MSELLDGSLGWWSATLAGACAACIAAYALAQPAVAHRYRRHVEELERELRYHGAAWTGAGVSSVQASGIALLTALGALSLSWVPVLLALALVRGPSLVLERLRVARTARIERQLDGFLIALAHALRATPALGDGLRSTAEVMAPPLAAELRLLLHEHDLGTPLDRALDAMARRIGSPIAGAALGTLRIARGSGGDFVRTLERTAATLREMGRLEGVVRTKTAEGRAQALVVSVLPVPLLFVIDRISPGLLVPLWSTDAGHLIIAIALTLWIAAVVAARRISQVDI